MQPFVGQILVFGGTFPPVGYVRCDGSLLAISQYAALFNLIGTTYGGDGQSTFGVPNLGGRVMVHQGSLPGGQSYPLGSTGGAAAVSLNAQQVAVHSHGVAVVPTPSSPTATPGNQTFLADAALPMYESGASPNTSLAPSSIAPAGSSAPHANQQPVLGLIACIAVYGIYPTPN